MSEETQTVETTEPQADQQADQQTEPQADQQPEQQSLPEVVPSPEERQALLEAVIYAADDPPTAATLAAGLGMPVDLVSQDLDRLVASYATARRGIEIRAVAGGYKMFTKPEHHEAVKAFVKSLRPKLRLSLPALETLAVIAYKQPVTVPEIQAVRGVNVAGVIHTLLKYRLISTAGRKKVIGRPMQYKSTKDFLIQFGLNDLSELPSLKEMEELSRAALGEDSFEAIVEPTDATESAEPESRETSS